MIDLPPNAKGASCGCGAFSPTGQPARMTFSHELTHQIIKYQLNDSVVQIPTYAGRADELSEKFKIEFKPFVRTAAVATDFAAEDRWGG